MVAMARATSSGLSRPSCLKVAATWLCAQLLKLSQSLLAELAGHVAAAAIEAAHPHGHYTLLDLLQGNIRDVCHARETKAF